jgi:hypothetical protein
MILLQAQDNGLESEVAIDFRTTDLVAHVVAPRSEIAGYPKAAYLVPYPSLCSPPCETCLPVANVASWRETSVDLTPRSRPRNLLSNGGSEVSAALPLRARFCHFSLVSIPSATSSALRTKSARSSGSRRTLAGGRSLRAYGRRTAARRAAATKNPVNLVNPV